jgi:diguanylate cyclase (GGDEF)-like protein
MEQEQKNMDDKEGTRVLVVDDEESLRGIVTQVLSEDGHDVSEASSAEEALEIFQQRSYPLVISDIKMPGMSGIELLQEIKKINTDTQFIIMTSYASLDTVITAMRHGAYDYLIKPFEDIDLVTAVANRAIEKIQLIKENQLLVNELVKKNNDLQKANERLVEMAVRDGLTGLYNHRYFQEALALEAARSLRYGHTFSLLFLDVDHFKRYNDTNGHLEGDRLLITLSQKVKEYVRGSDIVARYGGEEFVIILPETSRGNANQIAENIRTCVAEFPFKNRETQATDNITISIGVATFPEDGSDGASLLKHADDLLYKAKDSGRNKVCT